MGNYTVIRTDRVSGTREDKNLLSLKYAGEIENGSVVAVGAYIDGEREIRAATAPAKGAALNTLAIVATPEVVKNKDIYLLSDYTNDADTVLRAYRLTSKDEFGLTKEGFASGSVLAVGSIVELVDASTKLAAKASATSATTTIGKIVEISGGFYTFEVA
jgi:hypothetical protein